MVKKIFLLIISIAVTGTVVVLGYLWNAPNNSELLKPFFPKTLFSIANAPGQSLVGTISSMSGSVAWQSRAADYLALINSPIKLQQGETVSTYNNSKATLNFPTIGEITLSSGTQVNLIQTLPVNFVVEQQQGLATYNKNGNIPVSIRALDLLINLTEGNCTVSVDKNSSDISVAVNSGIITVAFNDTNNNTNILTIDAEKKYLFNNDTKLGKIKSL
jgi:hypothetical protein